MAIDLQARYRKSDSFVYRDIAGEAVLVPIRSHAADLDSLYVLNSVGSRIWELLDGQRALQEVLETLCEEYDVTRDAAEADLAEFVEQLAGLGGLELT
jgi:hypothetical protein